MKESKFWNQYGSVLLLLGGILIGSLIGIFSPDTGKILKPLGDIFINLLFTIVVPLVFISITAAVGTMVNRKRLGKILGSTLVTFIVTGLFASALVLIWVQFFSPASGGAIELSTTEIDKAQSVPDLIVSTLTVSDFYQLLDKSHMLALIIFAILFGLCVSMSGGENSPVGKLLKNLNEIIMHFVGIIMKLAPIGLGAYFANLIAEYGPQLLGDYGRSMIVYYPLCLLYILIFYPLYAYFSGGKEGVKRMLKHILTPAITAFATQSSAATLPVNKEACEKIGVPSDISDIVLPMGCTMHMDGSVLSSITKIVFLFATFNLPFTGIDTYAMSILVAICSAFVLSGAPGGGLVGEVLIVSMFGFPPEAFPLIATLGFLFDPMATALNASGDTIASMIVTRVVEGKGWILQHSKNCSK